MRTFKEEPRSVKSRQIVYTCRPAGAKEERNQPLLHTCRPAGACFFVEMRFYTDAASYGAKDPRIHTFPQSAQSVSSAIIRDSDENINMPPRRGYFFRQTPFLHRYHPSRAEDTTIHTFTSIRAIRVIRDNPRFRQMSHLRKP